MSTNNDKSTQRFYLWAEVLLYLKTCLYEISYWVENLSEVNSLEVSFSKVNSE